MNDPHPTPDRARQSVGEGARTGLRVTVPGSTSNLGPGYDLVGVALSLPLRVAARWHAERPGPDVRRGQAAAWPAAGDLMRTAFERVAGDAADGWHFEVDSEIPTSRGFGSSGAAVAAGLLLGSAVSATPWSDMELLALGVELEGHPENVSASLLGGATLTFSAPSGPLVLAQDVHPELAFAVAWPERPMSTAEARAALPDLLPHRAAVASAHHLAALLRGLAEGREELLRMAEHDALHVPYRLELLPGAGSALAAARAAGAWLATISGSGSGLFAIAPDGEVRAVADAMREALHAETGAGTGRVVDLVRERPRVERD